MIVTVIILNGIFDVHLSKELKLHVTNEKIEGDHFKFNIYDIEIDILFDNDKLLIKLEQAFSLKWLFLMVFEIIDYFDIKKILVNTLDNSSITHRTLRYVGFNYNEYTKTYSFETIKKSSL